jgi:hypothetical protein
MLQSHCLSSTFVMLSPLPPTPSTPLTPHPLCLTAATPEYLTPKVIQIDKKNIFAFCDTHDMSCSFLNGATAAQAWQESWKR